MRYVFFFVLIWLPTTLFAWADAGHKVIASIAFRQLPEEVRLTLAGIIEQHPRFTDDFAAKMPEEIKTGPAQERAEWIFQQAAIWPDLARDFRGEARKKYHHATWHYINTPVFFSAEEETALAGTLKVNVSLVPPETAAEDMNIVQCIGYARAAVKQASIPDADKAIWLCWLLHTIGDLHQPCHSTASFTRGVFADGDRGANRILTRQHGNLHALWDLFPGSNHPFREARNEALALLHEDHFITSGRAAAEKLDVRDWLTESRELSLKFVYADEVRAHVRQLDLAGKGEVPPLVLSAEYLKAGGNCSKTRLVEAGFRLGRVFAEIAAGQGMTPGVTPQ